MLATGTTEAAEVEVDGATRPGPDVTEIRLWSLTSPHAMQRATSSLVRIDQLRWSPDGRDVLATDGRGNVEVWDAQQAVRRFEIRDACGEAPGAAPIPLTYDATGQRIVGCGRSFDARTGGALPEDGAPSVVVRDGWGDLVGIVRAHAGQGLPDPRWSWSPDGASASRRDGCRVELVDTGTGRLVWSRRVEAPAGRDRCPPAIVGDRSEGMAFSPDGARLLSVQLGVVSLWDVATGDRLGAAEIDGVYAATAAFLPDPDRIVVWGASGELVVWRVSDGTVDRFRAPGRAATAVSFSPDGSRWLVGSDGGAVVAWDLTTGARVYTLAHGADVQSVVHGRDGDHLLTTSQDGIARLWDAATGELRASVVGDPRSGPLGSKICEVAFSDDTGEFLARSCGGPVDVFSVETPDLLIERRRADEGRVRFVPRSQRLLYSTRDAHRVVGFGAGAGLRFPAGETSAVFYRSAPLLAVWRQGRPTRGGRRRGDEPRVDLWDLGTGELRTLTGAQGRASALVPSGDGHHLAAATFDRGVWVWDLDRRDDRSPVWLDVTTGPTTHLEVALSSGGERVATLSDGDVRIWDASTGAPIRVAPVASVRASGLSWSPDGAWLTWIDDQRVARLWRPEGDGPALSLRVFSGGGWAWTEPGGRFDANEAPLGLVWWADGQGTPLEALAERRAPGLFERVVTTGSAP